MNIQAIYCTRCKEIIFSRSEHDFRTCSCEDNKAFVDGGRDYFRYSTNESCELITLDGDVLLELILNNDYRYGNTNIPDEWKESYHGKFKITERSNMKFFNRLVIEWGE